MSDRNFFAELKRRNVYKVAVAYIVASWLVIQGTSIFFPAFDAPASATRILIIILILGFPIALAFSWAFEITPEGIKRESEVDAELSITLWKDADSNIPLLTQAKEEYQKLP